MKINFTMQGMGRTGGTRVIFEVAKGLIDRGHVVVFTSLGKQDVHTWFPLKAEVRYVNPPLLLRGFRKFVVRRFYNLWNYDVELALARAIPDCDINVATYCFTAYPVYWSGKGVPFYYMQHFEPLFFDDPYFKKMAELTYCFPLNRIANSLWLKRQVRERFGVDATVVNPGVDLKTFHPYPVRRVDEVRKIVCLGKSTPWKGLTDLFEALKIVYKTLRNVKLLMYGSQPDIEAPIPYEYIYKPSDDELAKIYSSVDVVVIPSWYESSPLPPLEAMACGTPVVTTKYGTEDYAFHEKNVLVVPPRNPQKMAKAILRILSDDELAERLRRRGIETAKQFTWDKTVDKVEKLFEDAFSKKLKR